MRQFEIKVNGEVFAVEVEEVGGCPVASAAHAAAPKAAPAPAPKAAPAPAPKAAPKAAPAAAGANVVESPLPGTILKVNVAAGQAVKAGDIMMILEAMKMENEILAPEDGTVSAVHVQVGATVQSGDPLVSL